MSIRLVLTSALSLAADCLRAARAFDDEPALHFGARWQLLRAIERCRGAPTFADLGRTPRVSRQAAREQALKTAEAGLVEVFAAPEDRRLLQVALTSRGRREVERQRMPDFAWVFTLLSGLERDELKPRPRQRGIGSPFKNATSPRTCR